MFDKDFTLFAKHTKFQVSRILPTQFQLPRAPRHSHERRRWAIRSCPFAKTSVLSKGLVRGRSHAGAQLRSRKQENSYQGASFVAVYGSGSNQFSLFLYLLLLPLSKTRESSRPISLHLYIHLPLILTTQGLDPSHLDGRALATR